MLVPVEGHVRQPPDFLRAVATENREALISYVNSDDHIDLIIQSKGGSLLPALGLADWIINSEIPIYTWVSGYAASAATLLSCVGAKRFMTKHSVILLHQLSMGIEHSKFDQIEDQYKNGAILMNLIKQIYLEHSNMDIEQLDNILSHDYWLNSSQAKNLGLIDIIV